MKEHLTEHTYYHTHQIVAYLMEHFGVQYSVPGMNKWLHHHGFSYKLPKGVPHKFDEAKQQAFMKPSKQDMPRMNRFYLWVQFI